MSGDAAVPRLVFDGVSVVYPTPAGPMRAVDDLSLEIHQGDFVSIIGPSGCGKTTLMNLVAGFLVPTAGEVRLDGKRIVGPGPDRGVVFQDYGVFPWLTVEQNIGFGLSLRANRVGSAERTAICQRYMRLMGLRISPVPIRRRSPAGCASAWRSPEPMRCGRSSC